MSHDSDHDLEKSGEKSGILANKLLWLAIGAALFITVGFIIPVPESILKLMKEGGFGQKMIDLGIANDMWHAAWKTKLVLAMIPMAIIYFATKAMPIGLVGI